MSEVDWDATLTMEQLARSFRATADIESTSSPGLKMGVELGRGGMGVVRLAHQQMLGREVAVKSVLPARDTLTARNALLFEGRMTGFLEHPNIVPVHDIQLDGQGRPSLVLKRVEGVAWRELIRRDWAIPEEATDDPFGWHLGVLIQVCRAMEFAHAREIVHRDLKAENIMIGPFGEVYVLDWGLAVSLSPDPPVGLPTVRTLPSMCGTPQYMPPEMFQTPTSLNLAPETDVYLLGALLYYLLSDGEPLRRGSTINEMYATAKTMPAFEPSWPPSLVALMQDCFQQALSQRPSARAFRERLQHFLATRDIEELLARTLERQRRWREALANGAQRTEVYDLYGACKFGVDEVLAKWADNGLAIEAKEELLRRMCQFELDAGAPGAAAVYLRELGADAPLSVAVNSALQRQREDQTRLEAHDVMASQRVGWFSRLMVGSIVAFAATSVPIGSWLIGAGRSYPRFCIQDLMILGGLGLVALFFRHWIRKSTMNKAYFIAGVLTGLGALTVSGFGWALGLSAFVAAIMRVLIGCFALMFLGTVVDHRVLPSGVAQLLAAVGAVLAPQWASPLLIGATVFFGINLVTITLMSASERRPMLAPVRDAGG